MFTEKWKMLNTRNTISTPPTSLKSFQRLDENREESGKNENSFYKVALM